MFGFFFRGEKLSPEQHAAKLIARVQARRPGVQIRYVAAETLLRIEEVPVRKIFLENMYKDFLRAPQHERDAVLDRQAAVCAQAPEVPQMEGSYENHIRPKLVPVVRSRAYAAMLQHMDPSRYSEGIDMTDIKVPILPGRPLGEDRTVHVVLDTQHAMTQVSEEQLQTWGRSFEDVLADAVQNLRNATIPKWEPMEGGFFQAAWRDSYDCSRLLLPEVFTPLNLTGCAVAVVASREDLYVADEHDAAAQLAMLRFAGARLEENNRWQAGSLIVLQADGTWTPYKATEPTVRQAEANLRNLLMHREYANQKEGMDRLHAAAGKDLFVASFMAYRTQENDVFSMCTFSQGVEALLPKTDKVIFLATGLDGKPITPPMATVPWEIAQAIAGHLLTPVAMYPPRFHVREFPSGVVAERLRAAAQQQG